MDTQLVFDRYAAQVIGLAERAIAVGNELRHHEQRQTLDTGGCAIDARQHQVHDVLRHVLVAVGDEDLLAADQVVIAVRGSAGADRGQVRAGLWLGEIHGARPFTGHHLRQVGFLEEITAGHHQCFDGAVRQQRAEHEGHVGAAPDFLDRRAEHRRRALATVLGGNRQLRPAAFNILLVCCLEAWRGGHAGVTPLRASPIATLVERCEHLAGKAAGLVKHRLGQLGGIVRKTRQLRQLGAAEHVVEQEALIGDGGAVHAVHLKGISAAAIMTSVLKMTLTVERECRHGDKCRPHPL